MPLSSSRKKWMVLVVFLILVVLGFIGAMVFLFQQRKEYVVLREIPVTTYYTRTLTSTATLTRTMASSLVSTLIVTRESLIPTATVIHYDPRTISWVATTTDTVMTVIGNTTSIVLIRTLTYTYVFTTSVPLTNVIVIPMVVTETNTKWTTYNQTTVLTTTVTSTATVASTYTRTIWTTITAPPGAAANPPSTAHHVRSVMELALCSVLITGMFTFRKRSTS